MLETGDRRRLDRLPLVAGREGVIRPRNINTRQPRTGQRPDRLSVGLAGLEKLLGGVVVAAKDQQCWPRKPLKSPHHPLLKGERCVCKGIARGFSGAQPAGGKALQRTPDAQLAAQQLVPEFGL